MKGGRNKLRHQDLYETLLSRIDEYKRVHELTAEDDLKIMRQLADGNSTLKTSIDMPCARSTVYNSIDRVNRFLKNETTDFDLLKCSCTMSNALIRGRWSHRSAQGMNLYIAFIALHQHGRNSMQREEALKHMPGLRNRKQQETILMELNNLTVLTDEEQPKNIKVFEFVEYKEHTYYFELTEDAYPYYYPLYHLLGRHPQMPNLWN